jgi:hypothetical protein
MALKKSVITVHGFNVADAYHRVEGLSFESKDKINFQVRSSIDGSKPHFADAGYNCVYDLNGNNPIKQAYDHLKTLPEFSGATDC